MKSLIAVLLLAFPLAAQQPKPVNPAKATQETDGCSKEVQPSGFTGCQELRLHDLFGQMQPYQRALQELSVTANEFVEKVKSLHPDLDYVAPNQATAQAFPYGRFVPKPPPAPAKPADTAKPVAPAPTPEAPRK